MAKHRRLILTGVILLVLIASGAVYAMFFGSYAKIAHVSRNEITEVDVQADWGVFKKISSKEQIDRIYNYMNRQTYVRNYHAPLKTGGISFSFMNGEKELCSGIIMGDDDVEINWEAYSPLPRIDSGKFYDLVDMHPPR